MQAAVDIGTNSVRLLIAQRKETAGGSYYLPVVSRLEITRLGHSVDSSGILDEQAMARTFRVLEDYRDELTKYPVENLVVTATSAVRDGANREEFLDKVKILTGWDVRVLSGAKEAEASFVGAAKTLQGLGFTLAPRLAVLDIGGGSTELTYGTLDGGVLGSRSVQVGAVRMTELCITGHPVSSTELERLRRLVSSRVAPLTAVHPDGEVRPAEMTLIGVGGTITALAALELELAAYDWSKVTGAILTESRVTYWLEYLAKLDLAKRSLLPGISLGREDIIVAGAAICRETMGLLGIDQLMVSDGDLMQGLLYGTAFGAD
ncbi:MAG: Ppx/GppA family phosphatase [Firmicutes bacterium]|nr:Ppx/GppA family phosphatase [Bacillota bacterium]NLL88269.1 Ppx/GppA family phosphatase [Bacillota bacterium]HKM18357.1 Ppx/GppA family phosphatase [Limnochordia bacterium]